MTQSFFWHIVQMQQRFGLYRQKHVPFKSQKTQAGVIVGGVHVFKNHGIGHRHMAQGCTLKRAAQSVLPIVRQNARGQMHGNKRGMPLLPVKGGNEHRQRDRLAAHRKLGCAASFFLLCRVMQGPQGEGAHQRNIHRLHKKISVKAALRQSCNACPHRRKHALLRVRIAHSLQPQSHGLAFHNLGMKTAHNHHMLHASRAVLFYQPPQGRAAPAIGQQW